MSDNKITEKVLAQFVKGYREGIALDILAKAAYLEIKEARQLVSRLRKAGVGMPLRFRRLPSKIEKAVFDAFVAAQK